MTGTPTTLGTLIGRGRKDEKTGQTDQRVPYAFSVEHLGVCVPVNLRMVARFHD